MQTFTVTYSPTFATPTATTSATSSAPTAEVSSLNIRNCPGANGTDVVLPDGQTFAVVCGTNYGGPVDIGLYESSFGQCVSDCGISNNGFSAPRCRGVTYLPYSTGNDENCFWKNQAALDQFTADRNAVSAVLISLPLLSVTMAVPTVFPTATV
ncbi:MAG: hypothetical protein LQ350_001886 [Teloschistes chrysophthalmus]|nr:MAG: hypothetical protein LQ350_001886 [Niorma chrysophthalma]